MLHQAFYKSPIGWLKITSRANSITGLGFVEEKGMVVSSPYLQTCLKQLDQYFKRQRKNFSLNLFAAGTAFQKKVWQELLKIPYGYTASYQQIAQQIGDVKAVRAVAGACNKNPIGIIIPCHRVIGVDGKLVGYAHGLGKKKWLLGLENRQQCLNLDGLD